MYWINSNSGDYISLIDGVYCLHLITRYRPDYIPYEKIVISFIQYQSLKGFIPIKEKKLFNNRQRKEYGPTLSNGTKGAAVRVAIPDKQDIRNEILNQLLTNK